MESLAGRLCIKRMSTTVFIFVAREGESKMERWVAGARLAATRDLLDQLARVPDVSRIVIATNAPTLAEVHSDWPVTWDFDPPAEPFHFGRRLAALTSAYPSRSFAYFGAGSAPLLTPAVLADAMAQVARAAEPLAVTNNLLSSDWIIGNCAGAIQARPERLGRDNMLGPVLQFEAGVEVRGLLAGAATRADIDTPADVLALSLSAALPPALAHYLAAHPAPGHALQQWRLAQHLLTTPGSRVTLIGRVSAAVWSYLEAQTRCWTRVFSEERGMAASGRQAAGQVRSLVAMHLQRLGPRAFFAELEAMADAVLFDTRVVLASLGRWPPAADRFASDALQPAAIRDGFLRELTEAAAEAAMPALLGGHGLVTGDVYVLLESRAA